MCSAGIVGMVGGLIGGGINAYGQYKQGQAEETRLYGEAAIAENNAALASQDISLTQEEAEFGKTDVDIGAAELRGKGEVGFAAGNVLLGEGSAAQYNDAILTQAERDKGAIQQQADLQKNRFEGERRSLIYNAQQLRSAAGRVKKAASFGAAATFLGSASNAASQYSSLKARERQSQNLRNQPL